MTRLLGKTAPTTGAARGIGTVVAKRDRSEDARGKSEEIDLARTQAPSGEIVAQTNDVAGANG